MAKVDNKAKKNSSKKIKEESNVDVTDKVLADFLENNIGKIIDERIENDYTSKKNKQKIVETEVVENKEEVDVQTLVDDINKIETTNNEVVDNVNKTDNETEATNNEAVEINVNDENKDIEPTSEDKDIKSKQIEYRYVNVSSGVIYD